MILNLGSLSAAVRRRFIVPALMLSFAIVASPSALAQNAVNTATIAPPAGVGDPVAGNNTATDTDPIALPQLSLTKSHVGNFSVGVNGVYTLTLSNSSTVATGAPTNGTLTVADVLPTGLSFVSATGSGWTCNAVSSIVTCTTNAVINPQASAPAITLTVAVAAAAAPSTTNLARASGGGDTTCPAAGTTQARCIASDPTTVSTAPSFNFCAANTVFNITQAGGAVNIYQYGLGGAQDALIPGLTRTLSGGYNGLMIDKVRNRLLFVRQVSSNVAELWAYDPANGGWYAASPTFTASSVPRAGMTEDGEGYLIGNGATPPVWKVTTSGLFNYAVTSVPGGLEFNLPPTDSGSGDIAFDAGGNGWMTAGQDVYKIDFSLADLEAVRQQRPLLNGSPSTIAWAGVAFGSDDRLFVANNMPAPSQYYGIDLGAGTMVQTASTFANQALDLASCAFPAEPAPAQLEAHKTLALVNGNPYVAGAAVKPGDTLTYRIAIEHIGGDLAATLFAGDIDETVPANTTLVAAGNDFTCAGVNCTNTAAVNVPVGGNATVDFVVSVNNPLPAGVTSIGNVVAVEGVNCAAGANDCSETTPLAPVVTVAKTSNPASGATVNPGDVINYTLTVTVATSPTTAPVTLTDTLSAGQTPGAMPAGCSVAGQVVTCVLATASAPGTYTFVYPATVNANATGSISNNVVPSGTDAPTCAAGACTTTHPIVASAVSVAKTSNPASGATVNPGDAIQYTLTVTVANSATTGAITLTDTLSAGQTLGAMPAGCSAAGQVVTCTLAAGALPGAHAFTYPATVDANATGSVSNTVVPTGTDNPTCAAGACTTTHPIVAPVVSVSKVSNPPSGTIVSPGDTINYTLGISVSNSATTGPITLTDTLSAGQTLGAMPAGCSAAGQVVTCVLAAGALPSGVSYTFAYDATVDANATGSIGNNVVPTGPDNPTCSPSGCATTHPIVAPAVTVSKSSNPASGSTVNPGDAIQYTLTVNVANSATTGAVTLTDTLSAGQTLGAMPAGCLAAGQVVTCVLAGGALPGSYTFIYPATVDANATGSIGNSVVPSGPDNPTCVAGTCATTHPIVAPTVTVAKSSNPANGTTVNPGDAIQYTLTINVANSATTGAVTLTDTLSAGQTLGAMPAGCSAAGQVVTCVLAAGALPAGSPYTFVYSATVNANATGSVGNNVVPSGPDNPTCAPGACTTAHPIVATGVTVSKASNPPSGATVNPGDTIQYTLTINVANSATTAPVTLTDTLSVGQTLGAMPAGCAAVGQVATCTLAAGALPGTYTFVYPATVNADATGSVGNSVVPSGPDNPTCAAGVCATTHPIVAPAVTVSKSSNPASGSTVNPGDAIQYTLSVAVADSATTGAVTLTDTLSAGQTPGAMPAGCSAAGQVVTCVLAAGALPSGSPYTFVYSATVNANATGSIGNNVVPSGPDNPTCAASGCTTTHPIVPTAVTVAKTSNPASGATVNPGDTINYTLTVTVANSATTAPVTLTDTLSAGQTLGALPAGCSAVGQVVSCALAAGALPGTYTFVYPATVDANATGAIGNNVVPSGPDNPTCAASGCTTTHPIVATAVTVSKTSNPASGATVNPGDTIQYTLTANVANSATTAAITLTDTLSAGQTLGALPAGCAAAGQVVTCTLAAGALPGGSPYTFVYSATVDANATGSIGNNVVPSGPDNPTCAASGCATTHPIVPTAVTVSKSSNPTSGSTVNPGDAIGYTLTVTVANSATTAPVTLTDTLSAGQTLGALPAGCSAAGQIVTCVLGAGALPGSYSFAYAATVDANATGSIGNNVVPSGPDNPSCAAGGCTTTHPIVATAVAVSKTSNPASGTTVNPGDTIQYTLTVTVANSVTTAPVTLTDTLSAGQTLGALPAGCAAAGQVVTCTLAAGTLPGSHTFVYSATVDANATGSVGNAVVPSGPDNPGCGAGGCSTTHPIVAPQVTVAKSSDPASGTAVNANAAITYTVTVTVANSATTSAVVLDDTLSGDQSLTGTPTVPAGGNCTTAAGGLQCTLASGALPGSYAFVYRTVVAAAASGAIGNSVAATGGGTTPPACTNCTTQHPIAAPVVQVSKTSAPGDGATVNIGDTLQYTLTVTVANAAITQPVTLTDTPGTGLTVGTLPAGCAANGSGIVCTLPSGTVPGAYTFVYPATVNADANGNVANAVVANGGSTGGQPDCLACTTTHVVADAAQLRIVKQASPRDVKIGDLVRYTLTIENVGAANISDATLIDTPPAGFSYVADSLTVADADGAGRLVGTYPIRVDRLDVRVGEHATVRYLLRVGAGVRPGTHVNRARAEDGGRIVSNEATAEVQLVADPLLDESLLVGTVFDDRDGDGWQDRASLSGMRVQGGFAPSAYVAGSTTLDRGNGATPQPDASAPLLHGIDIGDIAGRQSDADPADAHAVVVSQTLNALSFTDDFVLTSKQGATLRMDAAGNTRVERSGDAAKGLNGADPQVERRISQVDGGYRVDYVIRNAGIDEHGIPGVRIASVEGLLIETDQFGRYHLEGVAGGPWERGRNFILKVDPATLPPGSAFTSDNPLVRRITPGIPVRFDFGIKLPSGLIEGGKQDVEMELGEVMFDGGSAQLRSQYSPVIDKIAEQVRQHTGGTVVIAANGETQTLAYDRAQAVRAALLEKLAPEQAKALEVELRTNVDDPDSALLALGETPVLGTFLFDTDQAAIKSEYAPLIDKLAADIQTRKGGAIAIVGHADRRGADAYNVVLGLRRAKAVFDAIAAKLSPEVRARLRVDISEKPTAPVGVRGQ